MFGSTFIEQIDQAIQLGQGAVGQVVGQTYDVRRLDAQTNVSVSANAPVITSFQASIREYRKREALEGMTFDLHTFVAVCNNMPLLDAIDPTDGLYHLPSITLWETGYEKGGSGVYTLARIRPTQETILVRTEFTASITRPYPTAGDAGTMPTEPGEWIEDEGYGGTPKANEQVMTLSGGLYSWQSEGAEMATVQVGIVQQKRVKEDNELRAASGMKLPGGEFFAYIPDLPGIVLKRNDRINLSQRYEIKSLFNSEATGFEGNVCVVEVMGV